MHSSFNNAVSTSDYTALNDWTIVTNELERMWMKCSSPNLLYYYDNWLKELTKSIQILR
jgi:hypothetical protein